jgi:hypothetical protein
MNRRKLSRSPEHIRFAAATEAGPVAEYRPDLGPCLLWVGSVKLNGYGQMRWNGRNGYVHRYAWTVAHGEIPEGMTVDHLCRVRNCVRVEHMELCTAVENYRRGARARTRCQSGHEKTPDNVRIDGKGNRRCLTCWRANQQREAARLRALRPAPLGFAGERNPAATITADTVRTIRASHAAGASIAELSRSFNLSQSQTSRIVRRMSWSAVV